ncbi:MAG: NAD-dependent deacylase [Flavobacteriales bacterium]|nr:NAD-dependent deacylase [Flavobacteriales bacterium]
MNKRRLIALTGAGISAESGLRTFRDSDGLWEEHRIEDVATPEAWEKDRDLVNRFYNLRRSQLAEAKPNEAHRQLAELQESWDVRVITQNVDDLHERAGSSEVLHLHGQLTQVRCSVCEEDIRDFGYSQLTRSDRCDLGHPLRPHIVWFGEPVPMIERAARWVESADVMLVVGTSLNVYPAAGLIHYRRSDCPIILVDPDTGMKAFESQGIQVINKKATEGMTLVARMLSELV